MSRTETTLLALILAGYLLVAGLFAALTPPWQAPDEPAHYNYIAQIARDGCCPVIAPGDWQSDYQAQLTRERFAPALLGRLDTIQYEDHQPPLYYLLGSMVFKLADGSLTALRLLSALIGAGVVLCAWGVGRALLPDRPAARLAAVALVAFLPQHVAVLASVNNDALAGLVVGLGLWLSVSHAQGGPARPWALGVVAGVGLLTKISTLLLLPVMALALLLRWRADRGRPASLARALAGLLIPALALGGVWIARNLAVYGFPDLFGLRAHDAVVAGQLRTADLIAQIGAGEYLRRALQTTFNSFWGQFGWMALPLPDWIYALIAALLLAALAGLAAGWAGRERPPAPETLAGALVLAAAVLLAVLAYAYYNTEFVQFQGRYLYPGLSPLALALALGLDEWGRRAAWALNRAVKGRPADADRLRLLLTPLPFLLLAPLDVYVLLRVIAPLLAP